MDYLALYKRQCKFCSYLDPEETKKYDRCHFSRGNEQCPAKEVQLAVVGEAVRCAAAVKAARAEGDLEKESRLLEKVAKATPAFKHKFKEHIK
jgi:hypothetical protein